MPDRREFIKMLAAAGIVAAIRSESKEDPQQEQATEVEAEQPTTIEDERWPEGGSSWEAELVEVAAPAVARVTVQLADGATFSFDVAELEITQSIPRDVLEFGEDSPLKSLFHGLYEHRLSMDMTIIGKPTVTM